MQGLGLIVWGCLPAAVLSWACASVPARGAPPGNGERVGLAVAVFLLQRHVLSCAQAVGLPRFQEFLPCSPTCWGRHRSSLLLTLGILTSVVGPPGLEGPFRRPSSATLSWCFLFLWGPLLSSSTSLFILSPCTSPRLHKLLFQHFGFDEVTS